MDNFPASARVDTHFHIFGAGVGFAGARYVPSYTASIDAWRSLASAAGISHGVLVQPSFLGTDNQLLLSTLAASGGQQAGVVVVAPDLAPCALAPMHQAGVRGIRLNFAGVAHDTAPWAQAAPLWDALLERNWHVEVHTDTGRLGEVLPQLPAALRVVVDHMGRPRTTSSQDPTLALMRRWRTGQLYVKLSGAYRQQGPDPALLARLLHDELGATSLLWGSDWPCTNHEDLADYAALCMQPGVWLPPESLEIVLRDNPQRLYWQA